MGKDITRSPEVDLVRPLARRTSVVATIAAILLTLGTPLSLYRWTRVTWETLGTSYANRMAGSTTGAWPGVQAFGGWKGSGSSGKGIGSFYTLALYMHEQSRTIIG